MISAIVYTSNTGYTKQYAELLGEKTGLPVYDFEQEKGKLHHDSSVIYLGWLMAGKIKWYSKAARYCRIAAVCGVGMGATGSQVQEVRKANSVPEDIPVFILQGGFDMDRLHGVYKMMMTVMVKTAGKGLADKADRTPEEDAMLDMMLHGGNYVSEENLKDVLDYMQSCV